MAKRVKQLSQGLMKSLENANNLVEILKFCQDEDRTVVKCAVQSLGEIFCHYLAIPSGPASRIYLQPGDDLEDNTLTAAEKLVKWLRGHYALGLDNLQKLMLHEDPGVQEAASMALCRVTVAETCARSRSKKGQHPYQFAVLTGRRIVVSLLDENQPCHTPLASVAEFLVQDDFRFHFLKTMDLLIKEKLDAEEVPPVFISNCFAVLKSISAPKFAEQITNFTTPMSETPTEPPRKKAKPGVDGEEKRRKEFYGDCATLPGHRRVFSTSWLNFLRLPLPMSILGRVLNNLHTNVMPFMSNPKLLIDFLTDAYDSGGAISLLALNGLFLLINKYNLDYPDFFKKLYALLQPSIFYQKYCCRFFRLANLFLRSSHLPAYMVAAFAKRLARISLRAPPQGCMIAVAMITNLLKRHPSCKLLIHRKVDGHLLDDSGEYLPPPEVAMDCDPYVGDELDMSKCRALDSCLWELQCLRNHFLPAVSKSLSLLETVNDIVEVNLEPYLENTYESLHAGLDTSEACLAASAVENAVKGQPLLPYP